MQCGLGTVLRAVRLRSASSPRYGERQQCLDFRELASRPKPVLNPSTHPSPRPAGGDPVVAGIGNARGQHGALDGALDALLKGMMAATDAQTRFR